MSLKKETLIKVSTFAHVAVAVTLSRLTSNIIEQLVLLLCIGTIGGIQCICIRKACGESSSGTPKTNGDVANHISPPSH